MQASTARALIELFTRHAGEQNNFLKDVETSESRAELERIRSMIGRIMGTIYLDGLRPIFDEHPDLKPPNL